MGFLRQTLPPEITPLRPGMRLAGPAYPIEGRPDHAADYDAAIRKVLEMLGQVPAGHVAVYQTNDRSSAHLGELSVTSLKARGCAGAVIDGGCRDVHLILRENYPVFTRYTTPQDCTYRWQLVAHGDVTVTIGEVSVAPGDYVVADADGIVVVPGDVLIEVLGQAEAEGRNGERDQGRGRAGALPARRVRAFRNLLVVKQLARPQLRCEACERRSYGSRTRGRKCTKSSRPTHRSHRSTGRGTTDPPSELALAPCRPRR